MATRLARGSLRPYPAMLNSRFRRLQPRVATHLTLRPPTAATLATRPAPRGRSMRSAMRAPARAGVVGRSRAQQGSRRRPQSPRALSGTPGECRKARTCSCARRVNVSPPTGPGRLPPIGPAGLARACARTTQRAATGTAALPPLRRLPTCVHAPKSTLGRNPQRLLGSRRPPRDPATRRLSTSAVVRPTSTPTSHPNPAAPLGGFPPCCR